MKRIVLNDRDNNIIEFLKEYKCANTSTLAAIFFNGSKRPCSRRLKNLREHGFINSSQEFVCLEQIHYVGKKPTQYIPRKYLAVPLINRQSSGQITTGLLSINIDGTLYIEGVVDNNRVIVNCSYVI